MKIMQKIAAKASNLREVPIPTIAFLGDSVTQGCFEIYQKNDGSIETVFDPSCAYHAYLAQKLHTLCPSAPVNIINAGISGDSAPGGAQRLERDVLCHHPDLTVVSYGLNDSSLGLSGVDRYTEALGDIFCRLKEAGSEVIFMTQNMMNTTISPFLPKEPVFRECAEGAAKTQNEGILKAYYEAAKETALRCGARVCDVYALWEQMASYGIDTTALLSNHINHPTREMNHLFADSLLRVMLDP